MAIKAYQSFNVYDNRPHLLAVSCPFAGVSLYHFTRLETTRQFGDVCFLEAVLNLSPKAHTKTDTSSQEKLFGEIQNSF